jgi:uncharacterized protein (TIGR02246 family)
MKRQDGAGGVEMTDADKDLRAIEELHRRDCAASRGGDFATLRSLMSDDAVVMPPGGRVRRGRAELDESFERMAEGMGAVEVLEYELDFEEVKVLGDYAFEWGTIRGAMRAKGGEEVERSTYKLMRILQKQRDGTWKVHRTIWNDNPK